jgi:dolichyl-phosphate-mannose-protein mannosyltransferase
MTKKWLVIFLIIASFITHFAFWGEPNEVVFDEVHFGKFVSSYDTHEYYFDIHPPLGKLIIFGFGKLLDFKSSDQFISIGEKFKGNDYLKLRLLPTLAGALIPIVIFFLCLELGFSLKASAFAGFLLTMENALIVQSRFILLDSFLLLFGFGSLLCFFIYRRKKAIPYLISMSILGAMAFSIKWTGASFIFLAGLMEVGFLIKDRFKINKEKIIWLLLGFFIIPFLTYFLIFSLHFSLLCKSGSGDTYMSQKFQKTLENNPARVNKKIENINIFGKFFELNNKMYTSNKNLKNQHPYSSHWYSWPIMQRPIYYWTSSDSRIYLIGNPLVWWLPLPVIIFAIFELFKRKNRNRLTLSFLLMGFLLNLLPFIFIYRVMFLYHYLSALIFSVIILAYTLDKKKMKKLGLIIIFLVFVFFLYFSPLTYGLPLDSASFQNRLWLESWE